MWQFLLRHLARQVRTLPATQAATRSLGVLIGKETNGPEVYADRIKRDLHLPDYGDAWSLYASDPAYWERRYGPTLKPDPGGDIVQDSARAAGIPSRYNGFEYGYLEPGGQPVSANSAAPSYSPNQVVNHRFGNWGSSPAASAPPAASGTSDSFDNRFGKWGLAPADNFNSSSSPALRELKKYRSSAVPEIPSALSSRMAPLLSALSSPDRRDFDFDVSGLPIWTRNALAYQPQNGSPVIAPTDENAAPDDPRNVRVLGARLARY
jgi:hypothetical protein